MLAFPLAFVSFGFLTWILGQWMRSRVEIALAVGALSVIGFLYGGALAGLLKPACVSLLVVPPVIGGALLARGGRPKLGWFLSHTVIAGFLLLLLAGWASQGFHFQNWDEWSHWARSSKYLAGANRLPEPGSMVMFLDYPPALNLWHYYWIALSPFNERTVLLSQIGLEVILIGAIFPSARRNWFHGIAVAVVALAVIALRRLANIPMFAIYLEGFLAEIFVLGIVSASRSGLSRGAMCLTILTVSVLPLAKSVGKLLSVFILLVLVIQIIRVWRKLPPRRRRRRLGAISLAVAGTAAAVLSWNLHLSQIGATRLFQPTAEASVSAFTKIVFDGGGTELQRETVENFQQAFMRWPAGYRTAFTFAEFFPWVAGITGILAFLTGRGVRGRMLAAWLATVVAAILYMGGLLSLYLFAFGNYEGPRVASLSRYLSIQVWIFLLFGLYLGVLVSRRWIFSSGPKWLAVPGPIKKGLVVAVAVLLVWFGNREYGLAKALRDEKKTVTTASTDYEFYKKQYRETIECMPHGSAYYFIHQGSNGWHKILFDYLTTGHHRKSNGCWSISGGPLYEGDVWTAKLEPNELAEQLSKEGYDFVYISHADPDFWLRYHHLFGREKSRADNDLIFQVNRSGSEIRLAPYPAPPGTDANLPPQ